MGLDRVRRSSLVFALGLCCCKSIAKGMISPSCPPRRRHLGDIVLFWHHSDKCTNLSGNSQPSSASDCKKTTSQQKKGLHTRMLGSGVMLRACYICLYEIKAAGPFVDSNLKLNNIRKNEKVSHGAHRRRDHAGRTARQDRKTRAPRTPARAQRMARRRDDMSKLMKVYGDLISCMLR